MNPLSTDVSYAVESFSNSVQFVYGTCWQMEGAKTFQAEIGFISWIPTQTMVRKAISLCKNMGLPVATRYLKSFNPFPNHDIVLQPNFTKLLL